MHRLVNIGYFGGSHGAFIAFFIDKFSSKTPEITGSPFMANGTSHSAGIQYSGKVNRYTFEDVNGVPTNNYKLENKGEPQILITIDEQSLMNYLRLHFTRKSDHELTSPEFTVTDNEILVSDNFVKMYGDKFKNLYEIDLSKTPALPYAIMRDFIKMHFVDNRQFKTFNDSKMTLRDIDENTICISLSEIWNTDQFINKMKIASDRLDLDLVLDDTAVSIHKQFLAKRQNNTTWNRVFDIIDCVEANTYKTCSDLDLVEQGYLYAWIEKSFEFVQAPLTRKFFTDTKEIAEYVAHYPNHYKAMNPNLPLFNGIPNPFYLWKK